MFLKLICLNQWNDTSTKVYRIQYIALRMTYPKEWSSVCNPDDEFLDNKTTVANDRSDRSPDKINQKQWSLKDMPKTYSSVVKKNKKKKRCIHSSIRVVLSQTKYVLREIIEFDNFIERIIFFVR